MIFTWPHATGLVGAPAVGKLGAGSWRNQNVLPSFFGNIVCLNQWFSHIVLGKMIVFESARVFLCFEDLFSMPPSSPMTNVFFRLEPPVYGCLSHNPSELIYLRVVMDGWKYWSVTSIPELPKICGLSMYMYTYMYVHIYIYVLYIKYIYIHACGCTYVG